MNLESLIIETGQKHHDAFIESDGADPEWPIWYANYLQKPLNALLNTDLTKSQIIFELIRLDQLHGGSDNWAREYANELLTKYGKHT